METAVSVILYTNNTSGLAKFWTMAWVWHLEVANTVLKYAFLEISPPLKITESDAESEHLNNYTAHPFTIV